MLPIYILSIVLLAITCRTLLPTSWPIWLSMLLGAIAVLITKSISVSQAFHAIDFNVIGFLLGAFFLAEALECSGLSRRFCMQIHQCVSRPQTVLLALILTTGIGSALFMNDTLAIIGVPIFMYFARSFSQDQQPWLLALAFAITIGSVTSPIGNPQNLLIAIHGNIHAPFITFCRYLLLPTLINLLLLYFFILIGYRKRLTTFSVTTAQQPINKPPSRALDTQSTLLALAIFIIMIIAKIIFVIANSPFHLPFYAIALTSCIPLLLLNSQRLTICKHLDWGTLLFFIALFILMKSVWLTPWVQKLAAQTNDHSHLTVMLGSTLLSQVISNVPAVALYLPLLKHLNSSTSTLLALACGSTMAGTFTIVGAASNIIIIQNSLKRGQDAFSNLAFMLMGIPLGCVCMCVYYCFLTF